MWQPQCATPCCNKICLESKNYEWAEARRGMFTIYPTYAVCNRQVPPENSAHTAHKWGKPPPMLTLMDRQLMAQVAQCMRQTVPVHTCLACRGTLRLLHPVYKPALTQVYSQFNAIIAVLFSCFPNFIFKLVMQNSIATCYSQWNSDQKCQGEKFKMQTTGKWGKCRRNVENLKFESRNTWLTCGCECSWWKFLEGSLRTQCIDT